jgi:hypothetical protein
MSTPSRKKSYRRATAIDAGDPELPYDDSSIDDFLIKLALKAQWDRFMPFPAEYRRTTTAPDPHTKEEYDQLIADLTAKLPKAIELITKVDLGIAKHGKQSIGKNIQEYEFKYDFLSDYKLNLKHKKRWYLFHGSNIGNWHSILRNGIKNMSGTRFMSHGAVLGSGVYLTSNLGMAIGYGLAVAVVEILTDPAPFSKRGSVFVIPDDSLLFPRYLLDCHGLSSSLDGGDILDYYKKMRESLIKENPKQRRIELEKKEISDYYVHDLNPITFIVMIKEHLYRCYIYNFPFTAPVLQSVYQLAPTRVAKEKFTSEGFYLYDFDNWAASKSILSVIVEIEQLDDSLRYTTEESPLFQSVV